MSLAKAQALAEDLKTKAKDGINIAQERQKAQRDKIQDTLDAQEAEQNTFMAVAEAWLEKKSITWVAGHLKRQRERLQSHLYPALDNKPVNTLTMAE